MKPIGFTSNRRSWRSREPKRLSQTDAIRAGLFDMRIPRTFSPKDRAHFADIIVGCARRLALRGVA